MELYAINRQLEHLEWLSHPVHQQYYDELISAARALQPNVKLPGSTEPHAWRRAYAIYEELVRHGKTAAVPVEPKVDYYQLNIDAAKQLRDQRSFVKNILGQNNYSESDVGLEPGDLTTIPDDNKALLKMSSRVDKIYRELRPLSADQTRIYFLEKRVLKLEAALAAK